MNATTRRALDTLNHRFYESFSRRFDATREHPWPGWQRLWDVNTARRSDLSPPLEILDVGCGNGRFARFAVDQIDAPITYLGLDGSLPLLAAARRRSRCGSKARWAATRLGDTFAKAAAGVRLRDPAAGGRFDLVVCLAVLHHLPGRRQRTAFVRHLASRLRPGGLLALSVWRFDQQRGFDRKRLPWREFRDLQLSRGEEPLDLAQLEPGDHLLTWDGNREVPRYCHLPDSAEIGGWIDGLELLDRYRADGASGRDNLYLLLTGSSSS